MPPRLLAATAVFGAATLSVLLGGPALWGDGRQALGLEVQDASWSAPPLQHALQQVAADAPEDARLLVVLAADDPAVLATFMTTSYCLTPRRLRFGTEPALLEQPQDCDHAVVLLPPEATAAGRTGWQVRGRWPVPRGTLWHLQREPR